MVMVVTIMFVPNLRRQTSEVVFCRDGVDRQCHCRSRWRDDVRCVKFGLFPKCKAIRENTATDKRTNEPRERERED